MTEPEAPLRVLVVDDHPVYRDGLAALLASMDGVEVAGTAADGREAVVAARRLTPDVVIMDIQMPVLDGIEATRRVTADNPALGVVVLTMSEDDGTVFAAMRAGARGYLLKGADQEEVVRAIVTVAHGGAVIGPALAARITHLLSPGSATATAAFPQLTERERQVLDLVAAGRSNAQIAEGLFLSPKTVRNVVSAIFGKIHVDDRAQAIVAAREAGLGRPGSPSAG